MKSKQLPSVIMVKRECPHCGITEERAITISFLMAYINRDAHCTVCGKEMASQKKLTQKMTNN